MRAVALVALLVGAGCASAPELAPLDAPPGGADAAFDFSDDAAFVLDRRELVLTGAADYSPPHRSPRAIALVDGVELRNFVLDAKMQQTGREYGHRDLCLFLGFESAERYYYVHLATTPDANAHNVFLVDGAPRRNLLPPQETGVDWGQEEWHHVRLVRDVDAGSIEVYFDDMESPVLSVVDDTIEWGRVGFGSFDDTGRFKDVLISGYEAREIEADGSPFAR